MNTPFNEKLKSKRLCHNYTQKNMADLINVEVSTYAHYESGKRKPSLENAQVLCQALEINIEDYFPNVREVHFSRYDVDNLNYTKSSIELFFIQKGALSFSELNSLLHDLTTAIKPMQEYWEQALHLASLNRELGDDGKTTQIVIFNPKELTLLFDSQNLQRKIIQMMINSNNSDNSSSTENVNSEKP